MDEANPGAVSRDTDEESLFLTCGICRKLPTNGNTSPAPKLLPCLHSFCFSCLEERFKSQQQQQQQRKEQSINIPSSGSQHRLKCPTCGQEFLVPPKGLGGFLDNRFLLENVGKITRTEDILDRVCTSCEDNSPATSYCLNCTDWLCDACVQAHQRVRVTKDHLIQSEEEYGMSERGEQQKPIFCHIHCQEPLKLFCASCEKLTCRDCQLVEHKDHKYQFAGEAAVGYRDFVKNQLNRLYEQAQPLTESIREVDKATKGLREKEALIEQEIRKASEKIIKAVKQRESVLVTELKALVLFKYKLLAKQSKDLKLMQKILQHNYGFTRYVLKNGSETALLYSRKQMSSRIQNLLSLKYKVNPVTHSDLYCSIDTEKFCHYVGKMGSVITPSDKTAGSSSSSRMDSRLPGSSTTTRPSALAALAAGSKNIVFKSSGVLANYLNSQKISSHPAVRAVTPGKSASMAHPSGGTISVSKKFDVNPASGITKAYGVTKAISSVAPVRNLSTPVTVSMSNGTTVPLHHFQNGTSAGMRVPKASPPRPASAGSTSSVGSSHRSSSPGHPGHNGWGSPESVGSVEAVAPATQEKQIPRLDPDAVATVAAAVVAAATEHEGKLPSLLRVKRSASSNGTPEPSVPASPPQVKVKQEKPDSPEQTSPCQVSQKQVSEALILLLTLYYISIYNNSE